MPHFKDATGRVHFLDDAAFAHLLPAGCVPIDDTEAATLRAAHTPNPRPGEIAARLAAIDAESIRALRAKAAGRGRPQDDAKLTALEDEADALRAELAAL